MSKIITSIEDFPSRNDLLPKEKTTLGTDTILFHAFDISHITQSKIKGENLEGYSVIITGVVKDGRRFNVVIDCLDIYYDVLLVSENTILQNDILEAAGIKKDDFNRYEIIEAFPGTEFNIEKKKYLRLKFSTYQSRKISLENIQKTNLYTTASDGRDLINFNIIKYEWTIANWSIIQNFHRIDNYLFISNGDDFQAVTRPLSSDKPICKTPTMPIYFHIPYDIEVNNTSDQMPDVKNRKEKVFMLSGGVYRSDITDPMISFTITHMNISKEYHNYMKSKRREEFIGNDRQNWVLIQTKSEEETLLMYADILGKIQPEFRSHFNGYSFDDPYICKRIEQYEKYKEFIDKLSIIPFYMVNYKPKNSIDLLDKTLRQTRIKMDGIYDNNDNRFRLTYVGSINIDVMCGLKKQDTKTEFVSSHALKSYLIAYNLPQKIDMPIKDMNKYYYDENSIGLLLASDYCLIDALSCHRLLDKSGLIISYLALADLALCKPEDSLIRAGGMKVKNIIYCFGKRLDIIYSEYNISEKIKGKYPGALVFPPDRGEYKDIPVIVLDFSSLYPSIMQDSNISPECYIDVDKRPKILAKIIDQGYDVFRFTTAWTDVDTNVSKNIAYVRKHPDQTPCRGVYSKCLEFLTNIRKIYKKQLATETEKLIHIQNELEVTPDCTILKDKLKEVLIRKQDRNQKQLAVKVINNTVYGQTGSTRFVLYNPYMAATTTLMGRKLITLVSDIAINKGYKRIYGDTDSVFLLPNKKLYVDINNSEDKIKLAEKLAIQDLLPEIKKQIQKLLQKSDNTIVKMELDKILYPCLMVGKKKYCGIIHEGNEPPKLYISGLEHIKRGQSKLVIDLSNKIINQILDLNIHKSVIDIVQNILKEGIDDLKEQSLEYFVKVKKYRTGKEGMLSLFIERMKKLSINNPELYSLPEPNTPFQYIITQRKNLHNYNGTKRSIKISDQMELLEVVQKSSLFIPDYLYYIRDTMGALSRLICFEPRFNLDEYTDFDMIDRKSNDSAKKYLKEFIENYLGINNIESKIVRSQCKIINIEFSKKYGEFLGIMQSAYDNEIRPNNFISYIISDCKLGYPIDIDYIEVDVNDEILIRINKLEKIKPKIIKVYTEYFNILSKASKIEINISINDRCNYNTFAIKLLNTLHTLKKLYTLKDTNTPVSDDPLLNLLNDRFLL